MEPYHGIPEKIYGVRAISRFVNLLGLAEAYYNRGNAYLDKEKKNMGTDRTTVFEGPCRCGNGTFQVDCCSPDHGWPVSTPFWYEPSIRCKECSEKYELQRQENLVVLVEKSGIRKRDQLLREANRIGQTLLSTPEVKSIVADFSRLLNRQVSKAAIYRLLCSVGLEYSSIGTFRKYWKGGEDWVKRHVSMYNLEQVMRVLNVENKAIQEKLKQIESLSEASKEPLPCVGDPIYVIKG
jgi:hypothetical protein